MRSQANLEEAKQAITAVINWESAATELRRCANDGSPPIPRYQLRLAALADLDNAERVEVAAQLPQSPQAMDVYVRARHALITLILADGNTPASVRPPLQRDYDDVCIGGAPVYQRAQARVRCRIVVQRVPIIESTFAQVYDDGRPRPKTSASPGRSSATKRTAATSGTRAAARTPSCDREPRTLTAALPETPDIAREQGLTGTVEVEVTLAADGRVVRAAVRSGPDILREAALTAARASTFSPGTVNCKPAGGTFLYVVEFTSQ